MSVYVVDANVVASGALQEESSPRRALLKTYDRGHVAPSAAVFLEISEVLTRPKIARYLAPHRGGDIIVALIAQAKLLKPALSRSLIAGTPRKTNTLNWHLRPKPWPSLAVIRICLCLIRGAGYEFCRLPIS